MLTDYEITQQARVGPIKDIAAKLGVEEADFMPYGDEIAKVKVNRQNGNRPVADVMMSMELLYLSTKEKEELPE